MSIRNIINQNPRSPNFNKIYDYLVLPTSSNVGQTYTVTSYNNPNNAVVPINEFATIDFDNPNLQNILQLNGSQLNFTNLGYAPNNIKVDLTINFNYIPIVITYGADPITSQPPTVLSLGLFLFELLTSGKFANIDNLIMCDLVLSNIEFTAPLQPNTLAGYYSGSVTINDYFDFFQPSTSTLYIRGGFINPIQMDASEITLINSIILTPPIGAPPSSINYLLSYSPSN